jgi:hypothetical protein
VSNRRRYTYFRRHRATDEGDTLSEREDVVLDAEAIDRSKFVLLDRFLELLEKCRRVLDAVEA